MATITYKCPNCGGGLIFDPEKGKFKCEYCGSVFSKEELDALNPDQASDQTIPEEMMSGTDDTSAGAASAGTASDGQSSGDAILYTCPSCGAEVITDKTTAATFCYYCHNPVVLGGKLSGSYLPDKIIPFKFNKEKATGTFLDYVRHKRYVPKAFFNKEQIEKLSGVYYPYWIYDCTVEGDASGKATRIRTWISGDTEFTETNIFHFERAGTISVQNISRNALKDSDRNLIDSVMPFRMEETQPFSMQYLQGFVAQRRDIESAEVSEELRQKARAYAQQSLRNSVTGYTSVTVEKSDFRPITESWQYVLLPVWVLTYRGGNGKNYYYAMNGQTGETRGILPVDNGKLFRTSSIVAAVLFAAALAVQWFFF